MPKTLLAIKTFKKNNVLDCLLESIEKHGYHTGNEVVIADDNPCEALEVFDYPEYPFLNAYLAGSRHGIAYNSNRLIWYFLNVSKADRLMLLDNDFCFTRPGLLEELEEAAVNEGIQHIMGYIIDADGNDGLQKTFPHKAQSADGRIKYHDGSHGVLQWYTRGIINKVGYFTRFPYFYGGEHSEHSNRAIYVQGFTPDVYPVYARSPRYIRSCPVNFHAYDVDLEQTFKDNYKVMHERLARTKQGLDLKEFGHHLDRDREVVLSRGEVFTPELLLHTIKHGRKTAGRKK